MSRVSVRDKSGNVVASVEYNTNLDYWDGKNNTCGEVGRHLGITKLKKLDVFVLIHGTQWQGEQDTAEIMTDEEATQAILKNGHEEIFQVPKFNRLRDLWESQKDEEE
jgi:hypothetical protein